LYDGLWVYVVEKSVDGCISAERWRNIRGDSQEAKKREISTPILADKERSEQKAIVLMVMERREEENKKRQETSTDFGNRAHHLTSQQDASHLLPRIPY
jgi:hypothetical protein